MLLGFHQSDLMTCMCDTSQKRYSISRPSWLARVERLRVVSDDGVGLRNFQSRSLDSTAAACRRAWRDGWLEREGVKKTERLQNHNLHQINGQEKEKDVNFEFRKGGKPKTPNVSGRSLVAVY
jgi:hypothetical protein